jgi:hypothetical protein
MEMASWKLKHNVTFNDVAQSVITQASSFDIHGTINEGNVILCNKAGMTHSKPTSKTSKSSTSSSTPKTPRPICTYLGCGRIGHLEARKSGTRRIKRGRVALIEEAERKLRRKLKLPWTLQIHKM